LPNTRCRPNSHLIIAMDILYLLIPLSLVLVLGIMGLFWWALQSGQFDNIEREGERILRGD
jgi:cbb3-type cytochrome oxidase maturation protein